MLVAGGQVDGCSVARYFLQRTDRGAGVSVLRSFSVLMDWQQRWFFGLPDVAMCWLWIGDGGVLGMSSLGQFCDSYG